MMLHTVPLRAHLAGVAWFGSGIGKGTGVLHIICPLWPLVSLSTPPILGTVPCPLHHVLCELPGILSTRHGPIIAQGHYVPQYAPVCPSMPLGLVRPDDTVESCALEEALGDVVAEAAGKLASEPEGSLLGVMAQAQTKPGSS